MNDLILKAIESSFDLQDKANRIMAGDDWVSEDIDWVTCAMVELGESVTWTGYKHWKKVEHNWHQAFVEVVDSYHFMLSFAISRGVKPQDTWSADLSAAVLDRCRYSVEQFKRADGLNAQKTLVKKAVKKLLKFCLAAEDNQTLYADDHHPRHVVVHHLYAAAAMGFSPEDFFNAYVPKNTLNLFRQDNGDREGTYPRMWHFKGEEIEDNQVVEALVKEDPTLALNSDRLTQALHAHLKAFNKYDL